MGLYLDGICSGLRGSGDRLCVPVVIGVNARGEKHFPAIGVGAPESTQSRREVLPSLKDRGPAAPKPATGDGAVGVRAAPEEVFPATRRPRCWMHETGKVPNYLPKRTRPGARKMLHDIWQAETREDAHKAFDPFVETFEANGSKATECLIGDRGELLTFHGLRPFLLQTVHRAVCRFQRTGANSRPGIGRAFLHQTRSKAPSPPSGTAPGAPKDASAGMACST